MHLDYTPEQRRLRDELRAYFDALMTEDLRAELSNKQGGGPLYKQALRQMGADGWLGIGWPKEFGGQGRSPIEQFIFTDEVQRAGYPLPFLTLNTVGPTIMEYGTDEQKQAFLPRILRGEIHFAIGYSEPNAGTDQAALRTRALHMDVPIAVALGLGFVRGAINTITDAGPIYFDGVATLIFLLLVGRFLQQRAQRFVVGEHELQGTVGKCRPAPHERAQASVFERNEALRLAECGPRGSDTPDAHHRCSLSIEE